VWGEAHPWRREATDGGKRCVGEREFSREVSPRVEEGRKDEAKQSQGGLRVEGLAFKVYLEAARRFIAPGGVPVS